MPDPSFLPGDAPGEAKVKICGLTRRADALHAEEAGADYLGVVLVPNTPRARTPEEARSLFEGVRVPSVIVVADMALSEIRRAAERVRASVIQLHGNEPPELAAELRKAGPWKIWKAIKVRRQADVLEGLSRFGGVVDGLLLDAWHAEKAGGTGTRFSWEAVTGVRDDFPPGLLFVAAGGLRPDNVREAVVELRPHVVDVSSGLEERPGIKSPLQVEKFIHRVRRATGEEGRDRG
jgi:phosphoribosylanthranilate isomerase